MDSRARGGGVRKCTPIGKHLPWDFWPLARPSKIANVGWAIYRLRRARVGQLSLFGKHHEPRRKSERNVTFWGWGVPSPRTKKRN